MTGWYQCKSCAESVTCQIRGTAILDIALRNNNNECPYYKYRPSTRLRSTYR